MLADLGYSFLSEGCEPPEGPNAPIWLNVLAHVSLAITTLFLVEIPVTLWASGPEYYNPFGRVTHATLHLFDALVIVITFVLEVILRGKEQELASLLIILRLWRLVKLVGGTSNNAHMEFLDIDLLLQGITVGAGEIEEENDKDLAETKKRLEETTSALMQAREENQQLRVRIAWLESGGIPNEGN